MRDMFEKKEFKKKDMVFEYCPSCGGDLDTGWECNVCGRDWLPWAYPWWDRVSDKIRGFVERFKGEGL